MLGLMEKLLTEPETLEVLLEAEEEGGDTDSVDSVDSDDYSYGETPPLGCADHGVRGFTGDVLRVASVG